MVGMRRREFIALVGVASATSSMLWPLFARAQEPRGKAPRIGLLQRARNENVVAFVEGLREAGYIDGQNALLETRIFEAALDQLPNLANDLVNLKCNVIVAASRYAVEAAMRATGTIPIVGIDLESDPVESGWARSLARPGRNFTGLVLDLPELSGKQIELLKEAVPRLSHLGVLWDANIAEVQFRATQAAARTAGVTLHFFPIQRPQDFDAAFERAKRERIIHGMVLLSSPLILEQRSQIADWALKALLPTISLFTLFPGSGGLMAYGPRLPDMYRRAAAYVDRILKGTNVGELPIERPTRFALVINLKTARALGLDPPATLLARADEVIE